MVGVADAFGYGHSSASALPSLALSYVPGSIWCLRQCGKDRNLHLLCFVVIARCATLIAAAFACRTTNDTAKADIMATMASHHHCIVHANAHARIQQQTTIPVLRLSSSLACNFASQVVIILGEAVVHSTLIPCRITYCFRVLQLSIPVGCDTQHTVCG